MFLVSKSSVILHKGLIVFAHAFFLFLEKNHKLYYVMFFLHPKFSHIYQHINKIKSSTRSKCQIINYRESKKPTFAYTMQCWQKLKFNWCDEKIWKYLSKLILYICIWRIKYIIDELGLYIYFRQQKIKLMYIDLYWTCHNRKKLRTILLMPHPPIKYTKKS